MPFTIKVGEPFWAVFSITDAVNVYGVDGFLIFDPTAVAMVTENDAFVSEVYNFFGEPSQIKLRLGYLNGQPGTVLFTMNRGELKIGKTGSGGLWRTKMKALKAGTHTLNFAANQCNVVSPNVVIVNGSPQAERLPSEFVGASLEATDPATFTKARITITFEAV